MSPVTTARRAFIALAATCTALLLCAGPADAVHSTSSDAAQDAVQLEVERQVHERELALTAMFDAAENYAMFEGVRNNRLEDLGYQGKVSDLQYILPIQDYHLSAGFGLSGPLWESIHTGLDFGAPTGTDVVAVGNGTITEVAYAGPYGIRVIVTLDDGTDLWYCHLLTPLVWQDQRIEIGQPIGLVGSTGNTTGPHLHFEVRPGGKEPLDPAYWLSAHDMAP